MRDIILMAIVLAGCIASLRRPWIGIMLWTWISIMNPHRYTYGFAFSAPVALMAALAVFVGAAMTQDRESPFKGGPSVWFTLFICWMTISWLFGLDVSGDYEQWKKVMKINGMLLFSLALLHNKQHIFALMWVCAGSIAFLGTKGGLFTLATGGSYRVWGPPGTFIGGNNEFALALVMVIPLLRFLQTQAETRLVRHSLSLSMVLCAAAALGSQSRGALLAISAMVVTLWWRSKKKFWSGIVFLIMSVGLVAFMPESWTERMNTIKTYEEDGSAMGRINAWWVASRIGLNYYTGVGFNPATEDLFARFGEYPDIPRAAHSIYFQILGNHGFFGLFLFLAIWASTWLTCSWLRAQKNLPPEAKWTIEMGGMCQVALVGYAVGGAFLSLAYFDLPYNIMVLAVLTRVWVYKKSWLTEPAYAPGWFTIPGLSTPPKAN